MCSCEGSEDKCDNTKVELVNDESGDHDDDDYDYEGHNDIDE